MTTNFATIGTPSLWLGFGVLVLAVEGLGIVFAVDSIPAIFVVTRDPFLIDTNIFAIPGLRALYFVLAGMVGGFRYLGVGLSIVLVFVGAKMLLAPNQRFEAKP